MDVTTWTDVTGFIGFFQAVNTVTYGMFGLGMFGIIYIILFVSFTMSMAGQGRPDSDRESLAISSFIMCIVTPMLSVLGLIDITIVSIPIALALVGVMASSYKT
jgi:hypothetical protein